MTRRDYRMYSPLKNQRRIHKKDIRRKVTRLGDRLDNTKRHKQNIDNYAQK